MAKRHPSPASARSQTTMESAHHNIPPDTHPEHSTSPSDQTLEVDQADGEQQPGPRPPGFVRKWWVWELLTLLLSIGCMVAVVVIGWKVDEKPLAHWTLPIGVNVLFSLLVTVSKAALMVPVGECISQLKWLYLAERERRLDVLSVFYDASKGPWGAFLFLSPKLILKWPVSASLGAFLTVVALTMGPFAQQTVVIRPHVWHDLDVAAVIPVSSTYGGMEFPDLTGAFWSGLFGLGTSFPYICPSGNCTWNNLTSLGIYSSRHGVSAATQAVVSSNLADAVGVYKIDVSFNTPSGSIVSPAFEFSRPGNRLAGSPVATNASAMNVGPNDKMTEQLASVTFVQQSMGYMTDSDIKKIANHQWVGNWTATECMISWCAKLYESVNILNGVLQPYSTTGIALKPMNSSRLQDMWYMALQTENGSARVFEDSPRHFPNNSFMVYFVQHIDLANFVEEKFVLRCDKTRPGENTDVAAFMDNITNSMSDAIGTTWGNIQARREMTRQDTIIHIEWAWLALPFAVVLLAAVLLGITMAAQARARWQALWKSSIWPLVFHGLDDWSPAEKRAWEDGSLQEAREMEAAAKGIRVTVQYNGVGTRTTQRP